MAQEIKLSDIMIKIGREIGSAIGPICRSRFGRGVLVAIGGYGNGDLDENSAPFVWVSPVDQDISVVSKQVTSFGVKIVIGICPRKDVPSTGTIHDALLTLSDAAISAANKSMQLALEIPDYLYLDERQRAILKAQAAQTAAESAVAKADEALVFLSNASVEDAISKTAEVSSASLTVLQRVADVIQIATSTGWEDLLPTIEETTAVNAVCQTRKEELSSAVNSYSNAAAAFEDCPYIVETTSVRTAATNGCVIYGGIRIFDDIRNKIIEVVSSSRVGLPVKEIVIKSNPQSAYPLDWTEADVVFGMPEVL